MQLATGTVVEGKVVLNGVRLPDGTQVTVIAPEKDVALRLSPSLQAELEDALAEADVEDGIPAEELLAQLQKYR
jgi:hypothetical protein